MNDDLRDILDEFLGRLRAELEHAGSDIETDWDELRAYAAERMNHLATIVGQSGYELALVAERDSIALKAGVFAVNAGVNAEQRWTGMIQGALITVAKVIALGLA